MNRKERFFNTLDGKTTDRLPFVFWKHFPKDCLNGPERIKIQTSLYEETGMDMIKMMIDGFIDLDANLKVTTSSDWRNIKLPAANSDFIQKQLDIINRVIDATHDEVPVYYHAHMPMGFLRHTFGTDLVFGHLSDPDSREDILYAISEVEKYEREYIDAYMTKTGACAMSFTVTGAEPNGLSDEIHAQVVAPMDQRMIRFASEYSQYNMLHLCGFSPEPNLIERWKDYEAPLITINPFQDHVSVKTARQCFPKARAFMGGFDVSAGGGLEKATREEIFAQVQQLKEDAGDMRLVIGGANTVANSVPNEHITWIREALEA